MENIPKLLEKYFVNLDIKNNTSDLKFFDNMESIMIMNSVNALEEICYNWDIESLKWFSNNWINDISNRYYNLTIENIIEFILEDNDLLYDNSITKFIIYYLNNLPVDKTTKTIKEYLLKINFQ
jgi:hypothetical protein